MERNRAIHDAVATLIRAASATAFVAQVVAVAATIGGKHWASWRRLGLGWRVWMELGDLNAVLALICLAGCFLLAVFRLSCGERAIKDTRWCGWLNVATILLRPFMPAIAAI